MKKFNFIIGLELKRICFCGEKARVRVYIRVISDSTTDFKLNDGKNRRFFIGGAVYIWVISDCTSTFAFPSGGKVAAERLTDEVLRRNLANSLSVKVMSNS